MKGFVNPYNFISFPKEKAKAYNEPNKPIYTGFIEYTITTKTPLFIPNSSSDKAFKESSVQDHKSYDFFSYTNLDSTRKYDNEYHVPVVPGSEMRGVVRNVYETLTDSCMGILNSDEYPIKRSAARFNPGLIYRNKLGSYSLYEANSFRIGEKAQNNSEPKGFEEYKNGTTLYYKTSNANGLISDYNEEEKFKNKGYLLKWGMCVKKSRYHLLVSNKKEVRGVKLTKDVIERKLSDIIDSYLSQPALQKENEEAYKEYRRDLQEFLNTKGEGYFPVNYSLLKPGYGIFYLAPAVYSKEISNNDIGLLAGKFAPCKDGNCPACDLFGYIGKNSSRGSKIRFTDLYVDTEKPDVKDYYLSKLTLQTLGGPKLGNVEFYLKKPDKKATFWTYDYYVKNGDIKIAKGELRGRKYYWHHQKVNLKSVVPTNLNKTVRPLADGIRFKGKLYFEGILEKQIKQLMWILNSGNEGLGLKLGSAKPLGFGSVTCEVQQVVKRTILIQNEKISYDMVPFEMSKVSYEDVGFSKEVKEQFYKIAGLTTIPKDVEITYPKTEEQKGKEAKEGFSWFVNNHGTVSGKGMATGRNDIKIREPLPSISEEDVSLPYYKSPQSTNNKSYNQKSKTTNNNWKNKKRNFK